MCYCLCTPAYACVNHDRTQSDTQTARSEPHALLPVNHMRTCLRIARILTACYGYSLVLLGAFGLWVCQKAVFGLKGLGFLGGATNGIRHTLLKWPGDLVPFDLYFLDGGEGSAFVHKT